MTTRRRTRSPHARHAATADADDRGVHEFSPGFLATLGGRLEAVEIAERVTTRLLEALAELWDSVRAEHPDVPAVILATGPHRPPRRGVRTILGCLSHPVWEPADSQPSELAAIDDDKLRAAIQRGDAQIAMGLMQLHVEAVMREAMQLSREASRLRGEVFITDAILGRGALDTLEVVLHEAAHTVAKQRGVKDTSSDGRYHNARFRHVAEELGLEARARDASIGWSATTLAPGVESRYAEPVARLAAALGDRAASTLADDEPVAPMVLCCDCGSFHRHARGRVLLARGVLCSTCRTAAG